MTGMTMEIVAHNEKSGAKLHIWPTFEKIGLEKPDKSQIFWKRNPVEKKPKRYFTRESIRKKEECKL